MFITLYDQKIELYSLAQLLTLSNFKGICPDLNIISGSMKIWLSMRLILISAAVVDAVALIWFKNLG